jgi:hypothetical protein
MIPRSPIAATTILKIFHCVASDPADSVFARSNGHAIMRRGAVCADSPSHQEACNDDDNDRR